MTIRGKLVLIVLWISSLVAVGAWAQTRVQVTGEARVLSGADLAFRVDRVDIEGTPVGTFVVKIDGKWVEPAFNPRVKPVIR